MFSLIQSLFLNAVTDIKETATAVNFTLMKLLALQNENNDTSELRAHTGSELVNEDLDLPSVLEVLTQNLAHNSIQTKVAVLKWIHDLYNKLPNKVGVCVIDLNLIFVCLMRIV